MNQGNFIRKTLPEREIDENMGKQEQIQMHLKLNWFK